MSRLLIATGNPGKVRELAALLPDLPLASLAEFPDAPEVVEDAPDFVGNAIKKARSAYAHSGLVSLADDSGIEVAALDWGPGVYSARYVPGTDRDRLLALLEATREATDRRARFRCVIALAGVAENLDLPPGIRRVEDCVISEGVVEGELLRAPRGDGGFGYDPIFALPDGRTTAELPAAEKHVVSHRGRAARALYPLLRALFP